MNNNCISQQDMAGKAAAVNYAMNARNAAVGWANDLLALEDGFVVLDLETTGLGNKAEACQIGIIDSNGAPLVSTLVKPNIPISPGASRVTGIDDEAVKYAPTFDQIAIDVHNALCGRCVVIYNRLFDWSVLQRIFSLYPGVVAFPASLAVECAMINYANFHGEWNSYRGSYKWQKLTAACAQMGVLVKGDVHDATVDCLMTLELVKAMVAEGGEYCPQCGRYVGHNIHYPCHPCHIPF